MLARHHMLLMVAIAAVLVLLALAIAMEPQTASGFLP
jgi:hypothetical protein